MYVWLAWLALGAGQTDWQKQEAVHLKNIRQVTRDFVRAGEGYFSPDGRQIIFQAEEKDTGNPFYQIFVMDLATGKYRRVSPGIGRTTCSYFRPDGKKIIFASSHRDPDAKKHQAHEYRRREADRRAHKQRHYQWDFDPYLAIYEANPDGSQLKPLTHVKCYNAEGSYSPDGKRIVFCSDRDGSLELYVMDADGGHVRRLTHTRHCYNGGPFFSPDGKRVIFRSDRKKKDMLQIYVINADGTGERALTDNVGVNWGPYWYKDARHVVYAAADHSNPAVRPNYDLWWMDVDESRKAANDSRAHAVGQARPFAPARLAGFATLYGSMLAPSSTGGVAQEKPGLPTPLRITFHPGADVLPVFSTDGKKIMWTSNRDGSAQLYLADFVRPSHR